jgi:hypothetical protein
LERAVTQILDYSAGYPGGSAVQRAGYAGVIRYLRKEGISRVLPITAAERADMLAQGRTIALVYQHVDKDRPTRGAPAGRHDAQWALDRARDVGIEPPAIYLAVDFDANPGDVVAFFAGAREILGARLGAYGGVRVLRRLFDDGLITWGWQTAAWSDGQRDGRAHLFQRIGQVNVGGISCDVNDVLKPDYGQIPQEDEMSAEAEAAILAMKAQFDEVARQTTIGAQNGTWTHHTNFAHTIADMASLVFQLNRKVDAMRPHSLPAIDEAALAKELANRGIAGVTAAQLIEVLSAVEGKP